jgi:hypothetical protein
MGWNDVRVSLVPLGRKLISETDPTARTSTNNPVAILHTVAIEGEIRTRIDPQLLEALLSEEKFVVTQRGATFVRMDRDNIESFLCLEDGALSEIILTFSVNRQSPTQVDDWQHLVDLLGNSVGMNLVDRGTQEPVVKGDIRQILANSPVWNQFARKWNWPPLSRPSGAESARMAATIASET